MLNGRQIMVLEDESILRKSLCAYLEKSGAQTYPARTLAEARDCYFSVGRKAWLYHQAGTTKVPCRWYYQFSSPGWSIEADLP